jgi:hypothetical protein
MQQQKRAPAEVLPEEPTKSGPQWDQWGVFLCCADEFEMQVAQQYRKQHYPGTPALLVSEIPIAQLQPQHIIIPIYRHRENPNGYSEAWQTVHNSNGTEFLMRTPVGELVKEMFEAEPIYIRDYMSKAPEQRVANTLSFVPLGGVLKWKGKDGLSGAISSRLQGSVALAAWREDVGMLKIGM